MTERWPKRGPLKAAKETEDGQCVAQLWPKPGRIEVGGCADSVPTLSQILSSEC